MKKIGINIDKVSVSYGTNVGSPGTELEFAL